MATQQTRRPVKKKVVHSEEAMHARKPAARRPQSHEEEIRARKAAAKRRAIEKNKAAKKSEKKKRGKILLFIAEIFVLLLMVVVLYGVLKTEKVGKVEISEKDIVINEEVKEMLEKDTSMKGYWNIALFGVDSRKGELTKNTRSDTIMIASINLDTKECKLVSVYRDTYLNLSNDTYNKCNAAYAKGGPKQAINMLNMNMDLNISDFVTIGFDGLEGVIDALGGVDINVTQAEIEHLNNYQISMVGKTTDDVHFYATAGTDYIPVTSPGMQTLNGLQATAYCRIRYVGDDFMRTQRQRDVLLAISEKAKKANVAQLNQVATDAFEHIYTSIDLEDILKMLADVTSYEVVGQGGFPEESMRATGTVGSKGSCVIPRDLKSNVIWLHQFLFNEPDYVPSSAVEEYSKKVAADTGGYVKADLE